jgi:hypothetical protein
MLGDQMRDRHAVGLVRAIGLRHGDYRCQSTPAISVQGPLVLRYSVVTAMSESGPNPAGRSKLTDVA